MEEESSDEYEEDDSDEDEAGLTKPPAAIGKPVMAVGELAFGSLRPYYKGPYPPSFSSFSSFQ